MEQLIPSYNYNRDFLATQDRSQTLRNPNPNSNPRWMRGAGHRQKCGEMPSELMSSKTDKWKSNVGSKWICDRPSVVEHPASDGWRCLTRWSSDLTLTRCECKSRLICPGCQLQRVSGWTLLPPQPVVLTCCLDCGWLIRFWWGALPPYAAPRQLTSVPPAWLMDVGHVELPTTPLENRGVALIIKKWWLMKNFPRLPVYLIMQ